jgi:ParB family chromosome partitioning protein
VEQVFTAIGRFTPQSFRASRLRLLKLPEDVLEALRAGKLEFTKAQAIAKLKPDLQRQELLSQAITHQLPLSAIKKLIHGNEALKAQPIERSKLRLEQRFRKLYATSLEMKIWTNPDVHRQLQDILDRLEIILGKEPTAERSM